MNRALAVIYATVVLDALGIGLVMPVIPALLRDFYAQDAVAARVGVYLAIYALMQLGFSPVLGVLSDRFGRRPVLLVSLAGAAGSYTILAATPYLWALYLGRVLAGATGASASVANAYVADVSAPDDRARRYGYLSACFGLGFVAGPAVGGLAGAWSPRYPFALAAAANALNFLLAWFALPESRKPGAEPDADPAPTQSLHPLAALRRAWVVPALAPLLVVYLVVQLAEQVGASVWVVYGEDRFAWGTRMVGFSLTVFGVLHAVAQVGLTGPAVRVLGERGAVALAFATEGAAYALMACATEGWMAFALMPLFTVGGLATPALLALASRCVGPDRQGELQGLLNSLTSLAAVVSPVASTGLYAATAGSWKGAVWAAGACLFVVSFPALRAQPRPPGVDDGGDSVG